MISAKLIKNINILLSITGIIILVFDLSITNEFDFESPYIFSVLGLLILNIFRQINSKIKSRKLINVLNNLLLLVLITFNLYSLLIMSFGVGFMGRDYPFIMTIAGIYNFVFIPFVIYDLGFDEKKRSESNIFQR
jgi:hypothetical protein